MIAPDASFVDLTQSHPLIRLALGDQTLRQRLRRVQTELRKLIDPARRSAMTSAEQSAVEEFLQSELRRLGLSAEDALLFERDLYRLLLQILPQPLRLQHLFLVELLHCHLEVEPHYWCRGGLVPPNPPLPRLVDIRRPKVANLSIVLPLFCLEAADAATRLARAAVADGSIRTWPILDCEIVLRLLLMHALLGSSEGDVRSVQACCDSFEDEGMPLWNAMAELVAWQTDPDAATLLWDSDLRTRVLLEMRRRCKGFGTAGSPARPVPNGATELDHATVKEALKEDVLSAPPVGFIRVITTPVPPSNHKEDQDTIAQYAALRKPVPVAAMPSAHHLQALLLSQEEEFPWAEAPLRLLRERLATASLLSVRELRLPPVLLVGAPGCGKSRFVRRLAQRLQMPYMPLALAGAHDPKLLSGTGRGWASGDASPLVKLLLQHSTASAFVLLDELDKLGRNGDPTPALANQLLGLLEPETARRFRDGFLQASCDLSRVIFWGTANGLAGIGKPLLSRMELVVMRGPGREHLPGIAAGIVADLEQEWQLPAGTLPPVPESVWSVGADNLRTMRRALLEYLHQWAQQERLPERMH